jgi:hypothetical protein
MIHSIVIAVLAASAFVAQPSKPAPKAVSKALAQKQLPEGYVFKAVLVKDEDCIKDVVRATQASGIEKRKQAEELVKYGCIESVDGPYHAYVTEIRMVTTTPGKRVGIYKAMLIFDIDMRKLITGKDPDISSDDVFKEGWIFEDKFHALTKEELTKIIEDQKHPWAELKE